MSWALTIDNLKDINILPVDKLDALSKDNPEYSHDAQIAFSMAKQAGLVSATISGGRTPSPYGGAATVVIAITGFDSSAIGKAVPQDGRDMRAAMRDTITWGYDEYQETAKYICRGCVRAPGYSHPRIETCIDPGECECEDCLAPSNV